MVNEKFSDEVFGMSWQKNELIEDVKVINIKEQGGKQQDLLAVSGGILKIKREHFVRECFVEWNYCG
jgi:hypothetical protein